MTAPSSTSGSPSACCSAAIGSARLDVERASTARRRRWGRAGTRRRAGARGRTARRAGARPGTAWHRRARGRAPTAASRRPGSPTRAAKRVDVARHERHELAAGAGSAGRACRTPAWRAGRPSSRPPCRASPAPSSATARPSSTSSGRRAASSSATVRAAERRGHLGEQVAVRLERLGGPLAAGHRPAPRRARGSSRSTSATCRTAIRASSAKAQPDRRARRWPRGAPPVAPELGELAGGVPVERALAGERLGQVAEQRQPGEGIGPLLRRVVVGHGPDAIGWPASSVVRRGPRPRRRCRAGHRSASGCWRWRVPTTTSRWLTPGDGSNGRRWRST